MNTVLICCDYYLPGYKAGGPITTLSSLVAAIQGRCSVFVVTADRDYLDSEPYPGVDRHAWNDLGGHMVRYLDPSSTSMASLAEIVSEVGPDAIYLNSLFSYSFSIRLLIARRIGKIKVPRWILCARGELNAAALQKSAWKKRLFLIAERMIGLHKDIIWQATNAHEFSRVHEIMGSGAKVVQVANLSRVVDDDNVPRLTEKEPGCLQVVFVARLNPHKNLMLLLDAMNALAGKVQLKIYGPVDDLNYWEACKRKMANLPDHIQVDYACVNRREVIIEAMRWAHVLVLPSRSENFGQVIYESLSVGTPVIVSNKTPWKNLADKGVGWDCNIETTADIRQALSELVLMDETNWQAMVSNAKAFARKSMQHEKIANEMMSMIFEH